MVSAIFASKLYQVSNRKDRIHSAYMDPLNAELVQQIDSYVSPKYQNMLKEEEDLEHAATSQAAGESDSTTSSGGSSSSSSFSSGGGGSFSRGGSSFSGSDEDLPGMVADEPSSDESGSDSPDADAGATESAAETSSDEPVEQSTVIASSCTENDAALEVDTIKGSLNVKEDTAGVSRIRVKDKELWIYYQDTVNLNNVMSSVIDTMNTLGYTYLEFSRLARSDNAIVFDIYESAQPIQPIEEDEDDKKKEAQYT